MIEVLWSADMLVEMTRLKVVIRFLGVASSPFIPFHRRVTFQYHGPLGNRALHLDSALDERHISPCGSCRGQEAVMYNDFPTMSHLVFCPDDYPQGHPAK